MLQRLLKSCLNMALLCAGLVIGLVLAELLLSVVLRSETDFLSHLRPGPYCEDPYFGVSSACAGRRVNMRVLTGAKRGMGTKQFAHYTLNQDGYRGPFTSAGASDQRKPINVFLIGGASQGFGFGVNDDDSYPAAVARYTCVPTRVHNIAFVGLDSRATWHYFLQRYANKFDEDFIFLAMYYRIGHSISYDDYVRHLKNSGKSVILFNKWIHNPRGMKDKPFSETFLYIYFMYNYDTIKAQLKKYKQKFAKLKKIFEKSFGIAASSAAEQQAPDTPAEQNAEPKRVSILRDFLKKVDSYAKSKGARMGLLLLPNSNSNTRLTDENFKAALPADGLLIDANGAIKKAGLQMKTLKDGHYSPIQTDVIGRTIAESLNLTLGCSVPREEAQDAITRPATR